MKHLLLALAVLALLPALGAHAQPDRITVIYMEVYAHNQDAQLDPELRQMSDALSMTGYTGFQFISAGKHNMTAGDSFTVELESGYTLQIHLDDIDLENAGLTVWMTRPGRESPVKLKLRINRNAATVIGGNDLRKGKLVVPIRVRYPSPPGDRATPSKRR
jgi:hypothetical protein